MSDNWVSLSLSYLLPARKVSSKQINLDQRWIQNWNLEQNIKLHVLTKKKGSQNRHKEESKMSDSCVTGVN